MGIKTGAVLLTGFIAGALIAWLVGSGNFSAPDASSILTGIQATIQFIKDLILNHIPELLFGGAAVILYQAFRKFPARRVRELRASRGVRLKSASKTSGTTILVEDFEFDSKSGRRISNGTGSPFERNSEYTEPESLTSVKLDAITEARVFERLGRNPQAISLLMERFAQEDGNMDEIAMELISVFEDEINQRYTVNDPADDLFEQRDEFFDLLGSKSHLLSSQTWFSICDRYPDEISPPSNIEQIFSRRIFAGQKT